MVMSYGLLCCCGDFSSGIFYEGVYKYCHPNFRLVNPNVNYWNKVFDVLCILIFCNKISSWMNEMYMKYHLISENDWTIENLYCPTYLQSMTNNVKVALSVGDATRVVYNYY
jgi:hypothetical protein